MLERIDSPIIASTKSEIEREAEFRSGAMERRRTRMEFWMGLVSGEESDPSQENGIPKLSDRIRASELAAKVDGDFVERKEVSIVATYREMIMTKAGRLEELCPPSEFAMLDADIVEMAESEEAGEYELA